MNASAQRTFDPLAFPLVKCTEKNGALTFSCMIRFSKNVGFPDVAMELKPSPRHPEIGSVLKLLDTSVTAPKYWLLTFKPPMLIVSYARVPCA
jgi:hypothetical protein